eukprot:jgi/Psemu1/35365/gm1.35365_g
MGVMKLQFKSISSSNCREPRVSSLDPRQSPTIKVRAVSIIDPISCQVTWVEPSLHIKVNPNVTLLLELEMGFKLEWGQSPLKNVVATSTMAAFSDSDAASLCCLSASKTASLLLLGEVKEATNRADEEEEEANQDQQRGTILAGTFMASGSCVT